MADTSPSLQFSEQNGVIYVEFPYGLALADMNHDRILEAFRASKYGTAHLFDNAISTALEEARRYRNDAPDSHQNLRNKIAELRNAQLSIQTSDDHMEAEASVVIAEGGKAIDKAAILHQLRETRVTTGIRRQAIEQIIALQKKRKPGSSFDVMIARGRAPKHGDNARFKPLVEDARKRILRPQERGDGTVDMRDLGKQISVKVGTIILEKIPPTKGQPGFTVYGESIPANDGEDKDLKAGKGTEVNADNPNQLVATQKGMPSFIDNTAEVDEILTMQNVDVSTGHVDYEGSVIITGSVGEGMRVKATGDITVGGYVDSAQLSAGGNITIAKGCIGHQLEADDEEDDENFSTLSTRVVAAGSIWVSYAQYSMLIGKHGVIVDKQLTHCHVITQGALCVGGEGKNAIGKLIGGVVETTSNVFTGQLGAPAGTKTRIYFQQPLDASEQEVETYSLLSQLREKLTQTKKLKVAKQRLASVDDPARRDRMAALINEEINQCAGEMATLRARIQLLQDMPPPALQLHVLITRSLFPGAIFRFEDKFYRVRERRGGTRMDLFDNDFVMDVLR